ncbi:MAG: hypothetical protein Q9180_005391 [Flavoplaca navasiana]
MESTPGSTPRSTPNQVTRRGPRRNKKPKRPTCIGYKVNGEPCSRPAPVDDVVCWQHPQWAPDYVSDATSTAEETTVNHQEHREPTVQNQPGPTSDAINVPSTLQRFRDYVVTGSPFPQQENGTSAILPSYLHPQPPPIPPSFTEASRNVPRQRTTAEDYQVLVPPRSSVTLTPSQVLLAQLISRVDPLAVQINQLLRILKTERDRQNAQDDDLE